ncbi:GFA family protein [Methylorubrum sp. SL192]|uniref:GFA family protein n=1 Tax=Methylorubrum sp. SL192 TaxID=2995167 RepID=UPI002273DBFD|nr:GFA family protein [Methylorubrum sp. SL192]MCY1640528.1 GFA family protein [Methylorubrum sp. SL192]
MSALNGGCMCGSISYSLNKEPRSLVICHCENCRKIGGGLFSLNAIISEKDFSSQGEISVFTDIGESGSPVYRHFCGKCGSPIYAKIASAPGKIVLKVGSLDSIDGLVPKVEIYTERSPEWLPPIKTTEKFRRGQ